MSQSILITGPITKELISEMISNIGGKTESGGHSIFIGQVRADVINGKKIRSIDYSAYEEMVKVEADKIKEIVLTKFSDAKTIDIIHSTGVVLAGEISLFVLVSAGHRKDAIMACSTAVELIKERFPVWKKEIFEDNSYLWK
jgi:molybdopterin synthase catalytic subunit